MKLKWLLIVQWQKIPLIQLLFNCYYLARLFQESNLEQKTSNEMLEGKTELSGITKINCTVKNIIFFACIKVLFFKVCAVLLLEILGKYVWNSAKVIVLQNKCSHWIRTSNWQTVYQYENKITSSITLEKHVMCPICIFYSALSLCSVAPYSFDNIRTISQNIK